MGGTIPWAGAERGAELSSNPHRSASRLWIWVARCFKLLPLTLPPSWSVPFNCEQSRPFLFEVALASVPLLQHQEKVKMPAILTPPAEGIRGYTVPHPKQSGQFFPPLILEYLHLEKNETDIGSHV